MTRYSLTLCLFVVCLMLGASCGKKIDLTSPSAAYRALYEGVKHSDVAKVKRVLSTSTLNEIQEWANNKNITLDEQIESSIIRAYPMPLPSELGAENIQGDTATIKVLTGHNKIITGFVKENGEWKTPYPILAESDEPVGPPPPIDFLQRASPSKR